MSPSEEQLEVAKARALVLKVRRELNTTPPPKLQIIRKL